MLRWTLLAIAFLGTVWGRIGAAPDPNTIPPFPAKWPAPCYGVAFSAVHDGVLFTISAAAQDSMGTPRLWQAPIRSQTDGNPEGAGRTYRAWVYTDSLEFLRWRIAYDHVWAECGFINWSTMSYRIQLEDLPLLDTRNMEKGAAELRKKYGDARAEKATGFLDGFPSHAGQLRAELTPHLGMRPGPQPGEIEYDFLPTGPNSWDDYVLYQSQMSIGRCRRQPPRPEIKLPVDMELEAEKVTEPFPAGFHEPFFAYGKPEAPFFVTKSGKVFQCLRPKGKEPRVVKVWDDPKRQVRTILNDADTNRTFVAGPDPAEGEGQWFYFELTEKPEKKPFDRSAVTAHAQEPLQSALIFARFLVKEGQLKDKAP
jgi:hypothetical protein